ncbi:hypothetical protein EVAR_34808_1 [Eumeta japonica]|uniref:Uncharacterized protein n=1 Tax=Eumeta variegata TaxID=151549 RepID=A0A4C1WDW5_EUMVA|nr:hypothetical protein EVAR_34808_1 [Eumeta japonica]
MSATASAHRAIDVGIGPNKKKLQAQLSDVASYRHSVAIGLHICVRIQGDRTKEMAISSTPVNGFDIYVKEDTQQNEQSHLVILGVILGGEGNGERESESECVALERMRVVYPLQASASVSNE